MKYQLNIQEFGGNGSKSEIAPKRDRRRKRKPQSGVMLINSTLKDALGRKEEPASIGEALNVVNKDRYDLNYEAYTENCQRCVVAYELQRRGYDVVALPTYWDDRLPTVVNVNGEPNGRWRGAFRHATNTNVSANRMSTVVNNIENKMSSFGKGSRGVIQVFWKNGGGHVFNVENVGGKTVYVDAQSGTRYKNGMDALDGGSPSSVRLIRTDNLRVSDRAKQFVTQASVYNSQRKKKQ